MFNYYFIIITLGVTCHVAPGMKVAYQVKYTDLSNMEVG
jgi:hypothetical protein